jgi:hypothetical protein
MSDMPRHFAFQPTGSSFALMLLTGFALAGCDSGRFDLCCVDNGDAVQVSPSGRAVAFVDPESYQAILNAPVSARPALECVVDEFASRFDSEPEAIVFALDFEDRSVTWARLMRERGFAWFPDLSELSEDEKYQHALAMREVLGILETLPNQPPWALNAPFRRLEKGVGAPPTRHCSPDCAPFLRGWVFLPTKESLVAGRFFHEFAHFWAAHLVVHSA